MGPLFALFSAISWGSADLLATKASRKIGNIPTLFWMSVVGCIIALVYFIFTFSTHNLAATYRWIPLLIFIGLLQTIAYLSMYKAFTDGKLPIVAPLIGTWSLITIILSIIFLKETLKPYHILAISIIIIGIILLSLNIEEIVRDKKIALLHGVPAALIAMFSFAISFFLTTPVTKDLGWFLPTLYYRLFGLGWTFAYLYLNRKKFKMIPEKNNLILLIVIGIIDMAGFFTYSIAINNGQTSIVAPITTTAPVYTTILAFIFLKERPTLLQFIGIIASITGVIIISR